jgi:hypothetical protein
MSLKRTISSENQIILYGSKRKKENMEMAAPKFLESY